MLKPHSLFQTRTFQSSVIALLGGLAPIAITCGYQHRLPTQNEAIATAALITAFSSGIVGRIETSPVYTPYGLPGPSLGDLEKNEEAPPP
jgi:hypothetical protein